MVEVVVAVEVGVVLMGEETERVLVVVAVCLVVAVVVVVPQ